MGTMISKKGFYINSLDGFRALAIMIVFLAHAGYGTIIPGGFGVTIFFFLSGFLITTLMRIEYEKNGNVNFKDFYLRRIFRIFPPLYITLIIIGGLCFTNFIQHDMQISAVLAQFFHLTNYYMIYRGEIGFIPETSILWSLCVEEHFYFVFPAVFLFLARRMSYNRMALVFTAIAIVVLLWRYYIVYVDGTSYQWRESFLARTYLATDTRIDSIIYGCIMGVWANPVLDRDVMVSQLKKIGFLTIALIVLLFCFFYRDQFFRETFRYSLQGMALFPVFYLAVIRSDWFIFRWLNWRMVRGLGIISYTFYLFHQTGIFLTKTYFQGSPVSDVILSFVVTVLFSVMMYFLIERHMSVLRKKITHS